MSALTLSHARLSLKGQVLIDDLSFAVPTGEVLSIMGPSGCGKSSLLNYLCGTLDRAFQAQGRIVLNGKTLQSLSVAERHVGMLYQSPSLFPHMTNLENLLFAIPAAVKGRQRQELALDRLKEFGLADKAFELPLGLSGGQQARIALLRTLLSEPDYLLLDEPFSKLDTYLKQSVRDFVLTQIQRSKLPTVLVTHDPEDVHTMSANGLVLQLD